MLYEVLRDLDHIITEATDPKVKLSIEEIQNRPHNRTSRSENHEYCSNGIRMVEIKDSVHPENIHASFLFN